MSTYINHVLINSFKQHRSGKSHASALEPCFNLLNISFLPVRPDSEGLTVSN